MPGKCPENTGEIPGKYQENTGKTAENPVATTLRKQRRFKDVMEKMDYTILNKAQAIFLKGLENETNVQAGFVTEVYFEGTPAEVCASGDLPVEGTPAGPCASGPAPKVGAAPLAKVFVAARSFYRLYINGELAMHGPARAAEGFLRADEIDVGKFLRTGNNIFAFEVSSYGDFFGSYSNDIVLGKGLLRAAIFVGQSVILTSPESFRGIRLSGRAQLAERISHCREMAEVYTIDANYTRWRTDPGVLAHEVAAVLSDEKIIPRGSELPSLERLGGARLAECGSAFIDPGAPFTESWFEKGYTYYDSLPDRPLKDYKMTVERPLQAGTSVVFADGAVCKEAAGKEAADREAAGKEAAGKEAAGKGIVCKTSGASADDTVYFYLDLGKPAVGFIDVELEAELPGIIDIVHIESPVLYDEKDELSGGANPVTRLKLKEAGLRVSFLSFEPALARFYRIYARNCGNVTLHSFAIRDYTARDKCGGSFLCSDDDLNRIYEASRLTLKLNTLDIFMDCPDRERGGWLCDSYWTGRAERMLYGETRVEKDFLENFLQTDAEKMWKGFFPECYPATKANYGTSPNITTWSFWLIKELSEYVRCSGDTDMPRRYENRLRAFTDGALSFVGDSGLLEDLPCIFVDWSFSNDERFLGNISTAANCLFASALKDLGGLLGDEALSARGDAMLEIIRGALGTHRRDFDYVPDAIIKNADGSLRGGGLCTESCNYLAVWSGLLRPGEGEKLIFNIVNAMGPHPRYTPATRLGRAGLFIGLQYRFDLLARLGAQEVLLKELAQFYGYQLKEGPGTLWESTDMNNTSRCHGFTAYTGVQLMRDVLGLGVPDELTKTVKIDPHPGDLRWARGFVNTSDGVISLSWVQKHGKPEMRLSLPEGWKAV